MFSVQKLILIIFIVIVLTIFLCDAAPRVVRDEYGNQLDFPDVDTNVNFPNNKSKGFIQSIIDMIKRLFGWEDKMIVREDGTVEYVDNNNGGFISRMGKRILQMINYVLSLIGLTDGESAVDMGSSIRSALFNEVEKEAPSFNRRE